MQVLLPPERIKIQPIEITNEPHEGSVKVKPEEEEKEKLARLHAKKLHAELQAKPQPEHKGSVETKDSDEELDLLTLPD